MIAAVGESLHAIWGAIEASDPRMLTYSEVVRRTGLDGLEVRTTMLELATDGVLVVDRRITDKSVGDIIVWKVNPSKVGLIQRRLGKPHLRLVAQGGKPIEIGGHPPG